MSFIDHFRHPINSDEIRFITEEQQRLEQAHVALFTEAQHLRDICDYMLAGRCNALVPTYDRFAEYNNNAPDFSEEKYRITCFRPNDSLRIVQSKGGRYVDCVISDSQVSITHEERAANGEHKISSQFTACKPAPHSHSTLELAALSEELLALQENLLIAAGYRELTMNPNARERLAKTAVEHVVSSTF